MMKKWPSKFRLVFRIVFISIWIIVILFSVGSYLQAPQEFAGPKIAAFLGELYGKVWPIYFTLSILRGFTLLPSTPLVIAGTLLFPDQPFAVLGVSLAGIVSSSTIIYFFSEYLGFSDFFEGRKPELIHRIKSKLEHPLGFMFVAVWAFFPLVPTDLVCYLAGTVRLNYWKFIGAVFVGELILCSFYIFFGGSVIKFVR